MATKKHTKAKPKTKITQTKSKPRAKKIYKTVRKRTATVAASNTPRAVSVPAPNPTHNVRNVFIILALIFIGLIVAVVMWVANNLHQATKASEEFTSSVIANNYNQAYTYFGVDLKNQQTLEAFSVKINELGINSTCNLEITSRGIDKSTDDKTISKIDGTLTCKDRTFKSMQEFVKTKNGQKLRSYTIIRK